MTVQRQIDQLIAQRASEWVETLKTAGPEEREAFVDWLRESRKHVAEFLSMVALDRELDGIDLQGRVDRAALLRRIAPQVVDMRNTASVKQSRPRRFTGWRIGLGLAAGLATLSLALVLTINSFPRPQEFATATGEQRTIELVDGSIVQLNAQSRLHVRMDGTSRELKLLSGEALFTAARDAQRPFLVRTHNATIQAIGTQFNVYARPTGTTVSVIEGKVRVSIDTDRATLGAGEQVLIDTNKHIQRKARPNIAGAVAWRQRRLVFQKTPLEEVVREFNRYNSSPRLKLEGIPAGSRHYSATFNADDPESFGDFLMREKDLAIDKRYGEIVISLSAR